MTLKQLKNPWTLAVIILSLVSAASYFGPLFSIPVFGVDGSAGFIKMLFSAGRYMDMATFLLVPVGAAGAMLTALAKSPGPHLLTVSFAALPLMFMLYFLYRLDSYPHAATLGGGEVSMLIAVGWGAWLCAASSLLCFAAACGLAATNLKAMRNQTKK